MKTVQSYAQRIHTTSGSFKADKSNEILPSRRSPLLPLPLQPKGVN